MLGELGLLLLEEGLQKVQLWKPRRVLFEETSLDVKVSQRAQGFKLALEHAAKFSGFTTGESATHEGKLRNQPPRCHAQLVNRLDGWFLTALFQSLAIRLPSVLEC